jgi:hypothetical protein
MSSNMLDRMIERNEFTLDLGGHKLGTESELSDGQKERILDRLRYAAMSDGVSVGLSIAGQHTITVKSSSDCQECGESLELVLSGKTLTARKCAFPNGVPFPFEHTLEVSSGRIAFLDRFTFLPEPAGLKRQMNMRASRDSFIAWAKAGFPCASCGNSCPRIYRKGNSILIGSFKSESVPDGYVEVGSIATDYWSWQIGDMAKLEQMASKANESVGPLAVLDVQPGKYKVLVHSLHEEHKGPHFATIELAG